jgi:hypothetical protein
VKWAPLEEDPVSLTSDRTGTTHHRWPAPPDDVAARVG